MRGGTRTAGALLALALLLTGCKGEPQPTSTPTPEPTPTPAPTATPEPRTLPFTLPFNAAGSFHPITGADRANLTLAPLLYRGLFALDGSFTPRNDLCAGYSVSEDGLIWTFRLADVTFSDGSDLTGKEAAASLNLARQSTRYAGRLSGISRVTAEEGAVAVTLTEPNGALPALLDVPIVKETGDGARPLGTGPYVLDGEGEDLRLMARQTGLPRKIIPLRSIGAGEDLVYAFDAGEVSLVNTDLTGTDALGYSGRLEATDYLTSTLLYLGCNTEKGPCAEEAVRRAVGLALDREEAAARLLANHAVAAALPIHPAAAGYDADLAATLSDPAQVARTLADAGWTPAEDGLLHRGRTSLTLRLLVNQENTYKVSLAQFLESCLESLGVGVEVQKVPFETYLEGVETGNFDLYLGEITMTADFDPTALISTEGSLNYGKFQDNATEDLLKVWRSARGTARTTAGKALYADLAQKAPILPICFKNGSVLTQWGQISGLQPAPHDVFAGLETWTVSDS